MPRFSSVPVMMLIFSFSAHAGSEHFGFYAKDNQDPVFLEQCQMFRSALDKKDMEAIKSFTDPAYFNHPGLTNALQDLVAKYRHEVDKSDYRQTSISIAKLANPDKAGISILYEYKSGKGHGNSGCTFKRIKDNAWRIMPDG
ncbi:hypothetical protein [Shewanella cyperi]|uniref:hypothetical protein n=1 Tax=Shewanella cyperi TaxID=2814292 RepID=UPI001A94B8C8|nr:hypothetical protein [Shewanella cyperi]QSX40148.1 hypothetical protein JYB84_14385 [Shewanella cyperi]